MDNLYICHERHFMQCSTGSFLAILVFCISGLPGIGLGLFRASPLYACHRAVEHLVALSHDILDKSVLRELCFFCCSLQGYVYQYASAWLMIL